MTDAATNASTDAALAPTDVALRVFHVDPTAPDGGDGSEGAPFNSVFAVALQAGDTLLRSSIWCPPAAR